MKLSELIKRSEEVLRDSGDVEVYIGAEIEPMEGSDYEAVFDGFAICEDEKGKALSVLLCDRELRLTFV